MAKKYGTGHTMGNIKGNMMAHSSKTTPFQNTGFHPKGGNVGEVSIEKLIASNAHNPGAKSLESAVLGKLHASTPISSGNAWTGGSGMAGGEGAKTRGSKA